MYNGLVERCFKECVDSFRKKDLDNTEEKVNTKQSFLFSPLSPSIHLFLSIFAVCSAYKVAARSS